MKTYLVSLSLGPVQSMIEAARRTRDLWCGSWLLAESAKAAAKVFHDKQNGCLIFPCPDNPDVDLAPSDKPKDDDANIANILRAQINLEDEAAVKALLTEAKQAAEKRLAALCDKARQEVSELTFHDDLWEAQKTDILEFFAAWVEVKNNKYEAASDRLGGLLAARKATRNFIPSAISAEGIGFSIPKSSLDGARESVINFSHNERKEKKYQTSLRKLGMSGGEELDALAVAKRRAGDVEQFTAYSRLAADTWIEKLGKEDSTSLKNVVDAYEKLVEPGLATRIKGNKDLAGSIYRALPYDAQLLFGFRMDNALANADESEKKLLTALQNVLKDIDEQPVPYAVILKADGDRMGELLSKAKTADDSREVSKALHGFAKSVRGIVRSHHGHAIYAGGDDVLALLPLENSVVCAATLAAHFKSAMNDVAEKLGVAEKERPTLSAGLGIGHVVEPLGRLRARADAAEKYAKGDGTNTPRNALAIRLGIRSGAETDWRCNWNEDTGEPQNCDGVIALQDFIAAYRANECPSRLGYDLRSISLRLEWATEANNKLPGIHAAELARTLSRARQRGGSNELSLAFKKIIEARAQKIGLAQLADELIIARWLSARTQSDIESLE